MLYLKFRLKHIYIFLLPLSLYAADISTMLKHCHNEICPSIASKQFYKLNHAATIWTTATGISSLGYTMLHTLQAAYLDGLDPRKYNIIALSKLSLTIDNANNLNTAELQHDLLTFEILLSNSYFIYATDLHYGVFSTPLHPTNINAIKTLQAIVTENDCSLISRLEPTNVQYTLLKRKLNNYQYIALTHQDKLLLPESAVQLQINAVGDSVVLLRKRLAISGELASATDNRVFTPELTAALMLFQANHGIYDDGILTSNTLLALNTPIEQIIQQLELNLDKLRQFPAFPANYTLINIPEYSMHVIANHKQAFSMDVAVGDAKHPSCVLNSKITALVVNPYWSIPDNIAIEELWLKLKEQGNAFLVKKHIIVLTKGSDGSLMPVSDSVKINWKALSLTEFKSYRFRQNPGVDNSLGKVKFTFKNKCGMYLHDTNQPEVFDLYRRDFSHGCIRIAQPYKFAQYLLKQNLSDTQIERLFQTTSNIGIILKSPQPLYLVYFTAWVNVDDYLQLRGDFYHLDNPQKYVVYLPAQAI